ncbi:hypothetical protein GJ496_005895 [Pomphorhynchus laevis]|nr:hypothetical protein GJ496_005895 [Pomphorhynchus laevis]
MYTLSNERNTQNELLSQADDYVDKIMRKTKHVLPYAARFCLVSTFVEDGLRMCFQWGQQRDYMASLWNMPKFLGTLFVIVNMVFQLVPSCMVLVKKNTLQASLILLVMAIFQMLAYNIFWDIRMALRILALVGGLLLLLVEETKASLSIYTGIPTSPKGEQSTNALQLVGRILLIFMFASILHFRNSLYLICIDIFGTAMMTLVTIGFKTKLCSTVLFFYLGLINVIMNPFWTARIGSPFHDILRYDFFQTLSVMGGLLYVVMLGPGGVSIDARKKQW